MQLLANPIAGQRDRSGLTCTCLLARDRQIILTTKQEEADAAARAAAAETLLRDEDGDRTTWEEVASTSTANPSSHEPHNVGRARNAWAYAKKMTVNNAVHLSVKRLTDGILQESLWAAHALNSTGDADEATFDMRVALQEAVSRRVRDLRTNHGTVATRIQSGGLNGARLSKSVWLEEVLDAQSNATALFDIRDYQMTMFKGRCVAPTHIEATFNDESHTASPSLHHYLMQALV